VLIERSKQKFIPFINERSQFGGLLRTNNTSKHIKSVNVSSKADLLASPLAKGNDMFGKSLQEKISEAALKKRNNPIKLTTQQNLRKTQMNAQ